jgi:hypothetical protein
MKNFYLPLLNDLKQNGKLDSALCRLISELETKLKDDET